MIHPVDSVSCASSYVVEPVFFFNLSRVDVFFRVFVECHSAVHIIFRFGALTIAAFIISATIFGLVIDEFGEEDERFIESQMWEEEGHKEHMLATWRRRSR